MDEMDVRKRAMTSSTSTATGARALIVMPTYNEAGNIEAIVRAILDAVAMVDVLIIDDNSPDGTGTLADHLASQLAAVHVIHREGKLGLGTAYRLGFHYAQAHGYEYVFEMDADFSHDPKYLGSFLAKMREADLVIGSRYVPGGSTPGWPMLRRAISGGGNSFARLVLGLPIHDATSGFRCYRTDAVTSLALDRVQSRGYAFQVELAYAMWQSGYQVREVPITFVDRTEGQSKMSRAIFLEAVGWVLRTRLTGSPAVVTRQGNKVSLDGGDTLADLGGQETAGLGGTPPTQRSFWSLARDVTVLWAITRLVLAIYTYFSLLLVNAGFGKTAPFTVDRLLSAWGHWDAIILLNIAQGGYSLPRYSAFFPLYPALIRGGLFLFGPQSALIVALVISNLSTLVGCLGLALLARVEGTAKGGGDLRAVLVVLAFPLAFFLAAPYTEGIFFALTTWALLSARRGRWWWAAALVFLAGLSRTTGVILILPLAWEYARQQGWLQFDRLRRGGWRRVFTGRALLRGIVVVGAAPVALGLWCLYCASHYKNALMWLYAENNFWYRQTMPPWEAFYHVGQLLAYLNPLSADMVRQLTDTIPLVAAIVLTVVLILKRRMSVFYALYMAGLLFLAVDSPARVYPLQPSLPYMMFMSAGRFLLPAVPLWLWLGQRVARSPRWEAALIYGGGMVQAALLAGFLLNWYIL